MYPIDLSSVVEWDVSENRYYPKSLDLDCPHCGRRANFTTSNPDYDGHRTTHSATGRCAACKSNVFVWAFKPTNHNQVPACQHLYIYPEPRNDRSTIDGFDLLPEPIQRAYRDTVKVYNTGVYGAAATLCRRTLEGIVDELQEGKQNGSLFKRLEKLGESVDLAKPLITLSHAVRQAGNLGAHYDLEKEPDKQTVEATLDLIEYLLEYVYTLPKRIDALNSYVEGLDKIDSSEQEEKSA